MTPEDEYVEQPPITPNQMRKMRIDDIGDNVVEHTLEGIAGSSVPMDVGEQEKVLGFYYHPFIPKGVRDKYEDRYFAYMGTEIPTSNLNERDEIWMLALLRDHQFLELKFGPLHGNMDRAAFFNNMIVQTRANIGMGKDGFARKLDKSFQIGYKPDIMDEKGMPPKKTGWRKFFPG